MEAGMTRMSRKWPAAAAAAATALGGVLATPAGASTSNEFHQTNLVSNRHDQGAQLFDQDLKNPWGLALGPTTPLWVANNNSGTATVYDVNPGGTTATKRSLTVTVPGGRTSTMDGPSPTGQVFNPTSGFVVTSAAGSGPAAFIFSSESGQITAWSPQADPVSMGTSTGQVESSSTTAVYKGLTMARDGRDTFLYAANFHDGTVDVFNSSFQPVHRPGAFRDPDIPAGFAPFGIQELRGFIYVTYAKQNADKHDDVAGPGNGFVDIFRPNGTKVKRLASQGTLSSPWGMALAPRGFGPFAGKLLVGDFGDGRINVFAPESGRFLGQLHDEHGTPVAIDDLWGLHFGTAATGGPKTLLFSAGINDEADGLVGSINAAG
jgi:uncharacterized protein (TIGR03118 family)